MSNCELCVSRHPREIWRGQNFYVIDASDADIAGFVRVIATRHVKEMTDLSQEERKELFEILTLVERVMIETMTPDKVNWATLGNMVAHVHWHVIARYRDDAFFPGSVWSERLRTTPAEATEARRAQARVMLQKLVEELQKNFS